jgi:23S rRNA (adenine2503-C2)-methyltransferase
MIPPFWGSVKIIAFIWAAIFVAREQNGRTGIMGWIRSFFGPPNVSLRGTVMELPVLVSPTTKTTLLGMDRAALAKFVASLGQPAYRAGQLARWMYERGAHSFAEMTDQPAALRARLDETATIGRGEIAGSQTSRDGTTKLLLRFPDGREVETVVLPYAERTTVCISSQVGCPVGCVFCATATMGFTRNLTAGEMVDQVLAARETAEAAGFPRLSHVVVMGMGEPLLNVPALTTALRLLHTEVGLSYRNLTVSTAGHVPGIHELAESGLPVTLALSLHAPNDPLRAELIPLSRKWGLGPVMEAARHYGTTTGRRVTLEYLLLGGVNDSEAHALELATLAQGVVSHVNLIPWNPADSFTRFNAPSRNAVRRFREALEARGVTVTQRMERGQDIAAACGQLAVQGKAAGVQAAVP